MNSSARQTRLLPLALLSLCLAPSNFAFAQEPSPQSTQLVPVRQKILVFTKSSGYEHAVVRRSGDAPSHAERILLQLGASLDIDVVLSKDGTIFDGDLSPYAAFFFFTSGDLTSKGTDGNPPMTRAGKERLLEAVAGGTGFIGCHSASDTFHSRGESSQNQSNRDPYIAMLGGEFVSHGEQQAAMMRVGNKSFPGLRSVRDGFALFEEWYALKNFAVDIHVLLAMETKGLEGDAYNRPAFPSTWVRMHENGRVFYTAMGHREDVWSNPLFHEILKGAMRWTTDRLAIDIPRNLVQVTPGAYTISSGR